MIDDQISDDADAVFERWWEENENNLLAGNKEGSHKAWWDKKTLQHLATTTVDNDVPVVI